MPLLGGAKVIGIRGVPLVMLVQPSQDQGRTDGKGNFSVADVPRADNIAVSVHGPGVIGGPLATGDRSGARRPLPRSNRSENGPPPGHASDRSSSVLHLTRRDAPQRLGSSSMHCSFTT